MMAVFSFSISHAEPQKGDAIITSSVSDARNLIPILATDSASSEIVSLVFNGLVKYDINIELTGDLAESWEIKKDGLEIIFHLKRGVKWHDGKPFTAEDVQFTYQKIIDPEVPTPYSGDFKKVKRLEIIDLYTVKVIYDEIFAPSLASWTMPIMPKHALESENLLDTGFARCPIGTGPYKFLKWQTASRIDLAANDEYFEHRPYINRYIYRVISDPDTAFLELSSGAVDLGALEPLQYKKLTDTERFKNNFNKLRYPSFSYTYMGFNLNNPLFKDKAVRRAIDLAINKNEIINGVLLGLGRISTGPFHPDSWAYNGNVEPVPFSPESALALLKKSGWGDSDCDGWLDKDGKMFAFTIITNQGNTMRTRTAEIIQRRLKEIGIKTDIRVLEWSVFLNEFINKKRFDACILGWSLSRDPDCYDIWHSSKTKEGEFNFLGYSNPEVDRLLDAGRRTFNQDERKKFYNKIHKIIYDDDPCVFLYVPDALVAVSDRFQNVKVSPIGIMYNIIDWYVPTEEEKYTRFK